MSCPNGILVHHSCLLDCPVGSSPSTENSRECVTTTCPAPLYATTTNKVICMKVSIPKGTGTCGANTTEWTPGSCYTDCSVYTLSEGATLCIKPTTHRPTEEPTCSWGYSYDRQCTIQAWFVCLILFLALACVLPFALLGLYMARKRRAVTNSWGIN